MFKKSILLLIALFIIALNNYVYSQNKDNSPINLSLEISSKYMWRGIEYGTAPTLFPMISFNKAGFSIFGMGAYAFNGSHQEVDLGVSYTYKGLTVGVSDYYYPSAVGEKDSYFDFNNKTTGHYVESYIMLSPFKIPLWFTLSTYVYGCDKNTDGNQAYSSYIEVGYNHYFNDNNYLSLIAGANLNKSFYTNYESGFNVVNIMIKYTHTLVINKFLLPVSASYIINPYKEKAFFTLSTYINF